MRKPALLLLLLSVIKLAISQQPLFKITEKGKTGYINNKGITIIPPVYSNGFEFKEGVAAVRENGLYGFIDSTGKYSIKPEFDYASYFVHGVALVYKKREPYFIDKKGKIILPPVYRSMELIDDHKAIITTKSKRCGIIDIRTYRLLLDTLYGYISDFKSGVAVVSKYDPALPIFTQEKAVIDTACNFIVPFGKFERIEYFHNGFADVTIDTIDYTTGVIDITGKLIKKEPYLGYWDITDPLPNGYYTFNSSTSGGQLYEGFIDSRGDTILNDTSYKKVTGFSCNRIIVEDHNGDHFVLNQQAKRVSDQPFDYIGKFFKNYAIVKKGDCYGIIDTNGQLVIQPQYNDIAFPDSTVDYFFFGIPDEKKMYGYKYGVADMNNRIIIQPILKCYQEKGFVNGLLYGIINNREAWFNQQGNIVWQQSIEDSKKIRPMNIDWKTYSAYQHSPSSDEVLPANNFSKSQLTFTIDTSQTMHLFDNYAAWKLMIGNGTKDTINLISITSLAILLEAIDEDGIWKTIEVIPAPIHAEGYLVTPMPPGSYWPVRILQFDGSFSTKLRAVIWYEDKDQKKQCIYSNVINTSINKTQFWRDFFYPQGVYNPNWSIEKTIDMKTIKKYVRSEWLPIKL